MNRGTPSLTITVVRTPARVVTGLAGTMRIEIADGKHS